MPDSPISPPIHPPIRPDAIDLATDPDPVAALHHALKAHGFVAVRNTAVSQALRDQAMHTAREYFAQPDVVKAQDVYTDTNANFGYQGLLSEALDPQQAADLKEAFTMRNLKTSSQTTETNTEKSWAASAFGATANELYAACSDTAMNLLGLIEEALGADASTLTRHHTGENMTLRYLHYPTANLSTGSRPSSPPKDEAKKTPKDKKMHQLGAGAHTDYGTITLLFSDGVAGLQLYDASSGPERGRWRDVEVAAGDILVNTGDLMSLWSDGLYPSTLHRVQPRIGKPERYSMAFFVDPDSSTRVSPLPCLLEKLLKKKGDDKNSPDAHPTTAKVVVAGEHIQARIEASQRTPA